MFPSLLSPSPFLDGLLGFYPVSVAHYNNALIASGFFFKGPKYFDLCFLIQPMPCDLRLAMVMVFTFLLEKLRPEKSHDLFARVNTGKEIPSVYICSFNKFLLNGRFLFVCMLFFQYLQGSVGYAKINQGFQTSGRAKPLW